MGPKSLKRLRQESKGKTLINWQKNKNQSGDESEESDEKVTPPASKSRKISQNSGASKRLGNIPDDTSSDDEPVSRFGRKVKEMKYMDEEDDEDEIPLVDLKKVKKDDSEEEAPLSPMKVEKNGADVIEFINIDNISVKDEESSDDDDSDDDDEEEEEEKPAPPPKKRPPPPPKKPVQPVQPAQTAQTAQTTTVPHIVKQSGGVTVYQCSKCPKTYARPSRLRRHFRKHTGDVRVRWYNCDICHKQFSTDQKLEKHLLRRHKEKLNLFDAVAVRDEVASAEAAAAQAAAAQVAQNTVNSLFTDEEEEIKPELVQVKVETFYEEYEDDMQTMIPKMEMDILSTPVKREFGNDEDSGGDDFDHYGDHFGDNYDDAGDDGEIENKSRSFGSSRAVDPFSDDRIAVLSDNDFSGSDIMSLSPFGRDENDFLSDTEIEDLSPVVSDDPDADDDPYRKSQSRVYKCTYCPRNFVVRENFTDHLAYHTQKEKPFPCEQCDQEFLTQGTLHYHIESTHLRARCGVCNELTGNLKSFLKHQRMHTKRIRYKYSCDMCAERFVLKPQLRKHKEELHSTGHFKCGECPMQFTSAMFFICHSKECHADPKPFRCDFCSFRTNKINHQAIHVRTHLNEFPFRCLDCMKLFRLEKDLLTHMKDHEENKVTKHRCDKCGKCFSTNSNVHRHMRKYCKKYKCEKCDKVFAKAQTLQQHQVVHGDERLFTCDVCGQSFNRPEGARVHMRIHSSERPFPCRICGRTFISATRKASHERQHMGQTWRYRCEDCNMGFTLKKDREEHLLTHVNHAKSMWCAVCDQRFMRKAKLIKHLKLHLSSKRKGMPKKKSR